MKQRAQRPHQGRVSIPLGTWKKFQVTSYKSKFPVPSNAFQLFACKLFQVTSDFFQVSSSKLQVPKNAFQFHFFYLGFFTWNLELIETLLDDGNIKSGNLKSLWLWHKFIFSYKNYFKSYIQCKIICPFI
jgi:hypothetical protein